mgnify:CR=1 FL=1
MSPLLANVVLNELDQWISSQWETFKMRKPYKPYYRENGVKDNSSQYKRLRETSRLKNMFIVRYADDFKIFCRNARDADKIFHAVRKWLKERLHLEINPEKSRVVNLHNRYSEFIGLKLKVQKKRRTKWTAVSHVSDKAKAAAVKNIKAAFKKMLNTEGEMRQYQAISRYNALIIGLHNYYQMATMVSEDFNDIEWKTGRQVKSQLRKQGAVKTTAGRGKDGKARDEIEKRYGKSKRMWYLRGHAIAPVGYVRTRNALSRDRSINRYSEEGRKKRHANLGVDMRTMLWLMRNPPKGSSVEYADNRIALYSAQKGKCAVTRAELKIGDIHCHHVKPRSKGGTDSYDNLILITEAAHKLIHATKPETIQKYMEAISPTAKQKITDLKKKKKK